MGRFIPNGYEPASGAAERRANYDLMRRISMLVDEVDALQTLTAITPWTNVTFQNSWTNLGGGDVRTVQYRRNGDIVELRGVMTGGTLGYGTPAFTLPAGFRVPTGRNEVTHLTLANAGYAQVACFSTGVVSASIPSGSGTNGFVYVDGVSFSVTL